MIIRVRKGKDPYVRIDKVPINDKRLSWKARGILSYLLSKPDDWHVMVADLVNQSPDGEYAVRTGIGELFEAGYAKREAIRENGRITKWEYIITERPEKTPLGENLDVEKLDVEDQGLLTNERALTNEKTEKGTSPNGDELCSELPFEHPQTHNEYVAAILYVLTHNLADWYEYVAERHGKHKGWLRGVFACGVHGFNGEAPASIEECEQLYQAVLATKKFPSPPKKKGSAVGYYRELIRRCKVGEMKALDESWAKKEG